MKQTIEIEVPEGKKAIWKDGKIVFEDTKSKLPKTWEEFCKIKNLIDSETYINANSKCVTIEGCFKIERNYYNDRNILPSKKAAEQHLAYMQLHQLRDCYRQGWVPVAFNGYSINRCYNPSINLINLEIVEYYYTSKFLTFQTKEIAEEFLTNFRDIIEQAGDLI